MSYFVAHKARDFDYSVYVGCILQYVPYLLLLLFCHCLEIMEVGTHMWIGQM